jgi:soluble lytic murein transglycosylase
VLEKLSAYGATDPSLLFDRARTARHLGNNQQAESFLFRLEPRGPARAHTQVWWSEVNAEVRQALQDRDPSTAYKLAANAGLSPGEEYAESEFLAGWIALRLLSQPSVALVHFQRLNDSVGRPLFSLSIHPSSHFPNQTSKRKISPEPWRYSQILARQLR